MRQTEMDTLRRALARGGGGRWSVIEIAGDPGMGKSTLVAAFARHAARAGWRVQLCRAGDDESAAALSSRPGTPRVLVVDDVHAAGPAVAELIAGVLRNPPAGPVLLLLTHRPRQLTGTSAAALATAVAAGVAQRITLGPLTAEEATGLLPAARRQPELVEAAEGNPLYLLGAAGTPVPERVRAVLLPELLAGPALERLVVRAAAVAGDPADPELIAAVAECEPQAVHRALDRLTAADVLRAADGPGFRFRHPVVRAVAYESAPAGWRVAAHARADRALRVRGASAAARARHLEVCAAPGDEEAAGTLGRAARDAVYRSPADAARWLSAALRLLPDEPGTADRRAALRLDCARALGLAGRLKESRTHLHRMLAELPVADPVRREPAVVLAARTEQLLGRHAEADALLRREFPTPGTAPATALACGALLRGDGEAALHWSTVVLRQAPKAAGLRVAATAVRYLAGRLTGGADNQDALDEAADLVDAMPDDELVAVLDPAGLLAEAELAAERLGAARRHTARLLTIARAAGRHDALATLHGITGRARVLAGDLAGAADSLDRADDAARRSGSPARRAEAAASRSWLHLWQGDAAAARFAAQAQEHDRMAARRLTGDGITLQAWRRFVDDPATADRLSLALDASGSDPLVRVRWLQLAATTCADRRLPAAAAVCAASAQRLADRTPGLRVQGYAELALSDSLLGTDPGASAAAARHAAELLARAGDPLGAARSRQRQETAGAASEGSAGIAALTVRETEIVTLVAEGLTNKEIARRLFLSPGTVSIHVGRAYAKLGVSRRAAAAARLAEAGLVGARPAGAP
ncbi:LuxR C-terminal-related transcriptional regulator [Actinoplanes sp. NPDC049548]|uniref:helix-turn-helix transcriptional regulator n=1 Tax=Actinoplanes sp. NPDC049548 TaxID=3155152 RepID=UPI00342E59ED